MVKNGIILLWKVYLHYLEESSQVIKSSPTSSHVGDFDCLNCFHSYSTKKNKKLKKHEKVCNDHNYCYVERPDKDNKILKYNHGEKSLKTPFLIYAYLRCSLALMSK